MREVKIAEGINACSMKTCVVGDAVSRGGPLDGGGGEGVGDGAECVHAVGDAVGLCVDGDNALHFARADGEDGVAVGGVCDGFGGLLLLDGLAFEDVGIDEADERGRGCVDERNGVRSGAGDGDGLAGGSELHAEGDARQDQRLRDFVGGGCHDADA